MEFSFSPSQGYDNNLDCDLTQLKQSKPMAPEHFTEQAHQPDSRNHGLVTIQSYQTIQPNRIIDFPAGDILGAQLSEVLESYHNSRVINILSQGMLLLGKVLGVNYDSVNIVQSIKIQTFGPDGGSGNAAEVVAPAPTAQHKMAEVSPPVMQPTPVPLLLGDGDEEGFDDEFEDNLEEYGDDFDTIKNGYLHPTRFIEEDMIDELSDEEDRFERKAKDVFTRNMLIRRQYTEGQSPPSPTMKTGMTLRELKRLTTEALHQEMEDLSIEQFTSRRYEDIASADVGAVDADVRKKLITEGYNREMEAKTLRIPHKPPAKQLPVAQPPMMLSGAPPAKMLSGAIPPKMLSAGLREVQKTRVPPTILVQPSGDYNEVSAVKNKIQPLLVLIIPISEPVFPTLNIPNLTIINPLQKQAIIQLANNDQFLGLFYVKDPNFKSYDIVTSAKDIHEYGVLCKINSFSSYHDDATGLKPLIVNLSTLSSIKLESLTPPEKSIKASDTADLEGVNLQQLVCLGTVLTRSPRCSKKLDIRKIVNKVLKKLAKLYHKSDPEYQKKFVEIMDRNYDNIASQSTNFYKVDDDNVEIINLKLNVICELLKAYFTTKYIKKGSNDENKVKLQYYLGIFQNICENIKMNSKAKDLLNVLEMELGNFDKTITY